MRTLEGVTIPTRLVWLGTLEQNRQLYSPCMHISRTVSCFDNHNALQIQWEFMQSTQSSLDRRHAELHYSYNVHKLCKYFLNVV